MSIEFNQKLGRLSIIFFLVFAVGETTCDRENVRNNKLKYNRFIVNIFTKSYYVDMITLVNVIKIFCDMLF